MAKQKCDSKVIVMESTFVMLDENTRKNLLENSFLKIITIEDKENINYLILKNE